LRRDIGAASAWTARFTLNFCRALLSLSAFGLGSALDCLFADKELGDDFSACARSSCPAFLRKNTLNLILNLGVSRLSGAQGFEARPVGCVVLLELHLIEALLVDLLLLLKRVFKPLNRVHKGQLFPFGLFPGRSGLSGFVFLTLAGLATEFFNFSLEAFGLGFGFLAFPSQGGNTTLAPGWGMLLGIAVLGLLIDFLCFFDYILFDVVEVGFHILDVVKIIGAVQQVFVHFLSNRLTANHLGGRVTPGSRSEENAIFLGNGQGI
jgi:hypothetical protein